MIPEVYGLRLLRQPAMRGVMLAILVGIVAVFRVFQVFTLSRDARWALDLSYYWTAGKQLLHGGSIYSAQQLAGPYAPEGQVGFLYPPPFASLFVPVAAVVPSDYRLLGWVWLAIGVAILAATVLAVARAEGLDRPTAGLGAHPERWLVAAALLLPPVIGELTVGNVHLELLGLLGIAWLGLRRESTKGDRIAGVAIGLATILKVFPALIILWLLLAGRRTAVVWSIVGMAAAAAITLPITGLQAWLDYPTVVANMGAVLDVHDSVAPTLWLEPVLGFALARAVVLIAGIAVVAYAARRRPPITGYAIAVTVSVLIAPAVFHHYLSVLVLPLLLAMVAGVRPLVLVVAYFLLWGGQQPALGDWAWALSRVPQTLAYILLIVALARVNSGIGRGRRAPALAPP